MMIGTELRVRRRRQTSRPSRRGLITSSTTRSNVDSPKRASASRPSVAWTTSKPSLRSVYLSSVWIDCSSSTRRMRGGLSSTGRSVPRVRGATLRDSMLDARIYRAALVPVLLAVIICAFSLGDQPAAVGTTLAPDAFSGARATRDTQTFANAYPDRRPGGPGDAALARRVVGAFRALRPAYEVTTPRFTGQTIDGERRLETVMARQIGAPGPELVVVAHRDAAARGAAAELSATATLLELARIVAGGRLRRTVTFVSTSGGSGGAAGARDLVHRLSGNPIDAVLVLGDVGSRPAPRPWTESCSEGSSLGPLRLRSPPDEAPRSEVATRPGAPGLVTQWTRLAFP